MTPTAAKTVCRAQSLLSGAAGLGLLLATLAPVFAQPAPGPAGTPPAEAAPAAVSAAAPSTTSPLTLPTVSAAPAPTPADGAPGTAAVPHAAEASTTTPSLLPADLSPWAMFLHADIVVKVVMVGLAAASVTTWTVWLAKTLQLVGARRRAVQGVRDLLRAETLGAVPPQRGGPLAALVHAAIHERDRSANLPADGIKERVAIALTRVEARAARAMLKGTGLVATIGSTAPFIGLFGTVWGIMNSFVGISRAHTTNLAVVAPGIAEALLATAIGLVAAIPAVIIYNQFTRGIANYRALLADGSAEVLRHLSRDLDRRYQPEGR